MAKALSNEFAYEHNINGVFILEFQCATIMVYFELN